MDKNLPVAVVLTSASCIQCLLSRGDGSLQSADPPASGDAFFEWSEACMAAIILGERRPLSKAERAGRPPVARVVNVHAKDGTAAIESAHEYVMSGDGSVSATAVTVPPMACFAPYLYRFPTYILVPAPEWSAFAGADAAATAAGSMYAFYPGSATTLVGYSAVATPLYRVEPGPPSSFFDLVADAPSELKPSRDERVAPLDHRDIAAWRLGGVGRCTSMVGT